MPRQDYKSLDSSKKISIIKDWLSTGDKYELISDRHETTPHIVRLSINEYLANTMTKNIVEEC